MSPHERATEDVAYSDPLDGIQMLPDRQWIRHRPALYIGGRDSRGLHLLVFELLENSLKAFTHSSRHVMLVALLEDGGCKVVDNGPGFPVDPATAPGKQIFELFCTRVGFYGPPSRGVGGIHRPYGLGLKIVNALSRRMIVEVETQGRVWQQSFERGQAVTPVVSIRDTTHTGTSITFWPDPEIFPLGPDCQFSWELIRTRLRELAFSHPSVKFGLIDDGSGWRREDLFYFPDGLPAYVRLLNRGEEVVHSRLFHCVHSIEEQRVEIVLQWTQSTEERILTYCNTHPTVLGGTHLTGFRAGLTAILMELLREHGWRSSHRLVRHIGTHCRRGLTAVIAVSLQYPAFDGATKDRLVNSETKGFVQQAFVRDFRNFLQRHPTDAAAILAKIQSNLSIS
jgi:DNA gyrase subunit B